MPLPTNAGIFIGTITSNVITESGDKKLPTVALALRLDAEIVGAEQVETSGLFITAYLYLEKRDGTVNSRAVDSLRECFPDWNGIEIGWFAEENLAGRQIRVTVEMDEYNGKVGPKVKWINPVNARGGAELKGAGAAELRAIRARLNSKLRATSTGTPIPPKRAEAPAMPPPAKPAAPPPKPEPQSESRPAPRSEAEVWDAYRKRSALSGGQEQEAWFKFLRENAGTDNAEQITPYKWGELYEILDEIPF